MSEKTIQAFGVEFFKGSKEDALHRIDALRSERFSYVVTPNVNHVVRLRNDLELRGAYRSSMMQLCDSRILGVLFSILYRKISLSVIPGSDLTVDVLDLAEREERSVAIVGASEADVDVIRMKYPRVTFFHHNPPMGFIDVPVEVERCVSFVAQSSANYVLLAVGSPRQELLAKRIWEEGSCRGVGLCIGASVLFLSGGLRRAPKWVQILCLEWLFRMMSEPRRLLGRYFRDAFGLIGVFLDELRARKSVVRMGRVKR